jgi:hypothetical protein
LKVFQIYFDESQRAGLDYESLRNDDCTVYFESSVIRQLVESGAHAGHDYFGVVSHQLRSKLDYTRDRWAGEIANVSTRAFSPAAFEVEVQRAAPDVMGFQTHPPHDPVSLADRFHPGFAAHFRNIMAAIGYGWEPTVFEHVFYFNYFVARPAIYERYVTEMLAPAMAIMDRMPELMQDSRYPRPLPVALQARFGVPHYPFHPFLCERFFSYFAHMNRLRCATY